VAVLPSRIRGAAGEERIGAHTLRRRGMGGELRELREYVPGDPFKLIAWKASARSPFGRPLVRELEREMVLTHYLLLDIGGTMREGPPGQWKLDHAIELCLGYAATALGDGDRLGLIAFDGAIYRHCKPGDGPTQRLLVCERLLEVMNVVEEGFVAATDGELVEAVARYLRQQEGLDAQVHRPPALEDQAAWAELAVTPNREMYSIKQLVAAARRLLPPPKPGAVVAKSDLELLRQLCRHLGIELPYGQRAAASRMAGLSTALELAAQTGGARLVLLSDLLGLGLEDDAPQLRRAVALCRRRGHQLLCIRPEARRYLPKLLGAGAAPLAAASEQASQHPRPAESEPSRQAAASPLSRSRVANIFSWEHDRQEARMHRMLAKIGFHVIAVGPEDGLAQVFARPPNKPRVRAPA
jgi:hypothetical protein